MRFDIGRKSVAPSHLLDLANATCQRVVLDTLGVLRDLDRSLSFVFSHFCSYFVAIISYSLPEKGIAIVDLDISGAFGRYKRLFFSILLL